MWAHQRRTTTWLGAYGGDTPKPLQLYHSEPAFASLKRRLPQKARPRKRLVKKLAGGKFRGIAARLKKSQEYTLEFCRTVATIKQGLN